MKPVKVHRKIVKKKFICSTIPQSTLSALPATPQCLRREVPPASNAPESGVQPLLLSPAGTLILNPGNRSVLTVSPGLNDCIPGAGRFRFLRGLEDKKRISTFFRIL